MHQCVEQEPKPRLELRLDRLDAQLLAWLPTTHARRRWDGVSVELARHLFECWTVISYQERLNVKGAIASCQLQFSDNPSGTWHPNNE
jgi:hypothetical protein